MELGDKEMHKRSLQLSDACGVAVRGIFGIKYDPGVVFRLLGGWLGD